MLTQQLEKENIIESEKRELYRYGFQQGLILALNFITSILIGFLFGMVKESLLLLAAYIPLRSYAGGHHSDSSERCYVVSSLIMVVWLSILKYLSVPNNCCAIMIIISLVICLILSPVEDKNKPFDKDEYRLYRKLSLLILLIEIGVWIVMVLFIHTFEAVISIAIFTEAIMLVLGRIKNELVDSCKM